MNLDINVLDETEKIIFALRALYQAYGYRRYRMSKFEEYDLYSKNKDFLVSDSVITFTDTDGKLMALKPDVTLSIIKNDKDHAENIRKLCYNESVYRVSKGTGTFKEITQTGLECIGNIDAFCIREVLYLAAKSLQMVSEDYILQISGLDIVSRFVSEISDDIEIQKKIMKCVGERNRHGIREILMLNRICEEKAEKLLKLLDLSGNPSQVLKELKNLASDIPLNSGLQIKNEIDEMTEALQSLEETEIYPHILIDFTLVSDMNYYNGIAFKGFISGIPESVLSGGQYDRLMTKMGRKSGAIGFAVYLDLLERLNV